VTQNNGPAKTVTNKGFGIMISQPFHPPSVAPEPLSLLMPVLDLNLINLSEITNALTEGPPSTTLAAVLPPFAGFQRWLKLFLVGGIFETCRRVTFHAWDNILDSFWITVDLEEGNRSHGE